MNPFFSVVIPTYNRVDYLRSTLDTVFRQTFTDYEIIIVDDGSTDGTAEYLQSLENRVRVFAQKNAGPGAARNLGAKYARGTYLAFLDSDDLWFPWALESFHAAITNCREPALVIASLIPFSEPSEIANIESGTLAYNSFRDVKDALIAGCLAGAGKIVCRKDIFQAANGFSNELFVAEDHEFSFRLAGSGSAVLIKQPVVLAYRKHEGSTWAQAERLYAGMVYLLESYRSGAYRHHIPARELAPVLSMHLRPATLTILRTGNRSQAINLYRKGFRIHLAARKFKFIFGFLALLLQGQKP